MDTDATGDSVERIPADSAPPAGDAASAIARSEERSRGRGLIREAAAHRRAERTHLRAAELHDAAAEIWEGRGCSTEAAAEQSKAKEQRAAAESERVRGGQADRARSA